MDARQVSLLNKAFVAALELCYNLIVQQIAARVFGSCPYVMAVAGAPRTAQPCFCVQSLILGCDVLQADGGTRTASVTGAYVALVLALRKMIANRTASPRALKTAVAAVSAGIIDGAEMLDLCYEEDSRAQADFNVVMTAEGRFIEVQGTAEGEPFAREPMDRLINLARDGIEELLKIQQTALS